MYPKIKFTAKSLKEKNNVCHSALIVIINWCFTTILWEFLKFEQVELVQNMPAICLPYPILRNLQPFIPCEKNKKQNKKQKKKTKKQKKTTKNKTEKKKK